MKKVFSFIPYVRDNGTAATADKSHSRYIFYLNLIWFLTYANFIIYSIVIFFLQPFNHPNFIWSVILLHTSYIGIFLMVRKGYFQIARHLFMVTVYAMIAYSDFLFGKMAFNQVFYFAFLPTAFNIFSLKKNSKSIIFYIVLILALLLFSELYIYKNIVPSSWANIIKEPVRILNMISGFVLCVLYSGFMIFNSGRKQSKLIVQSIALQTTLNNSMGAIWSIDTDYKIVALNKLFAKFAETEFGIFGMEPGYDLTEILLSAQMPLQLRQHYTKVLNGEFILDEVAFKDQIYEVKAECILDENKNIIGATFTSRNVTHIKQAQAFLLKAKQDAEKASENRTLFLSNMSHELRTPLNGLIGLTNIMLSEQHLQKQQPNLELMGNLSDHMMLLINNILDYTKIEAGKVTLDILRFNLHQNLMKLQPMFVHAAALKKISFQIITTGIDDIYLKGDSTRLNQVLINLISNAIKFTEKGGVKLHVNIDGATDTLCRVSFKVEDTGIGIHKDNLTKIFEGFTQADTRTTRKFGGTGLGLTIADNIIKMMDARLEVQSEMHKGSMFSFTINFPKSSAGKMTEAPRKINEFEPFENVNILVAEDNNINQMVVKKMFDKWNIHTAIVSNGRLALDAVRAKKYHLILMDLDMPEMDGYEATTAIRAFDATIPIVALTAASFENMKVSLLTKGFTDVLQKPFVPLELHSKIKEITTCII